MQINAFLTAYDPSDLPGGSVDPLGFERGYLYLADKILPGMTNVASCPRYFGMLCAGSYLAGCEADESTVKVVAKRQEAVLRLERLWALANVLAYGKEGENALSGLRGVSYARKHAELLTEKGAAETRSDFRLLSRQVPYGVIGIYASVADRAKLVWRSTLEPRPGLGEELAAAFIEETVMPKTVKKAILDSDCTVGLAELTAWGQRSYLWGTTGKRERQCMRDVLHGNVVRSAFAELLSELPFLPKEDELCRLARVVGRIENKQKQRHLWESAEAILRYEVCYRCVQLVLDRLLDLCRSYPGGTLPVRVVNSDETIRSARATLKAAVPRLVSHLDAAETGHFREGQDTLQDVRQFLELAVAAGGNEQLVDAVVDRHTGVQQGKFDRGHRKMPWVKRDGDQWLLTMLTPSGRSKAPSKPEDIEPHPYRLVAADNWLKAAGA